MIKSISEIRKLQLSDEGSYPGSNIQDDIIRPRTECYGYPSLQTPLLH